MKLRTRILILMIGGSLFIQCNSDLNEDLGDGYSYRDEGGHTKDILSEKPNGGQIPATVVSFDYNKDYIIAKQKPKIPPDPLYEKEYKYPNGVNEFYYWLIVKSEKKVFGPLNIGDFEKKKTQYNVSSDLKLK